MSLRDQRAPTTPDEHRRAVEDAEFRLRRKLSPAETRIDIVAQDRDLRNGKQALTDAVQEEQRRAAAAAANGDPVRLTVTDAMIEAISDLYDAGVEHATRELEDAGVTLA